MTKVYHTSPYGELVLPAHDHQTVTALAHGHYEPVYVEMLSHLLAERPGVAVDVGACFGFHTVAYARAATRVYAIEPNPVALDFLADNVKRNGLSNVTIIPCAAHDVEAMGYVETPDDTNIGHTIVSKTTGLSAVAMRPLDDLDIEGPVRLIKIDVEGAEAAVIRGARAIIKRDRPVVFVEDSGTWKGMINFFLDDMGYWNYRRLSKNVLFTP